MKSLYCVTNKLFNFDFDLLGYFQRLCTLVGRKLTFFLVLLTLP